LVAFLPEGYLAQAGFCRGEPHPPQDLVLCYPDIDLIGRQGIYAPQASKVLHRINSLPFAVETPLRSRSLYSTALVCAIAIFHWPGQSRLDITRLRRIFHTSILHCGSRGQFGISSESGDKMAELTDHEQILYSRQMLIEGWSSEGQVALKTSTVFIAGAGGLGSPVSIYLAVAGVGELKICDADTIELSNLNRQILHGISRIGELKALSASKTLTELNPDVKLAIRSDFLDATNVQRIVGQPDLVVDCLDNFETRYLLNSYCFAHGIPFIHGAVHGMLGQVTFLFPPETPCLRCLFPEPPPKEIFPVVGATPGIIGSIQAMEALKYLTGIGTTLKERLLFFDGEDMSFSLLKVRRSDSCPDCGHLTQALNDATVGRA
jgi:molybdopterin/thiamine biosynthesis adenylyltransferase